MNWFLWALLSAVCAALTAVLAKVGLREVNSDFASLVRTAVILPVTAVFVWYVGAWSNPLQLSGRTLGFLVASGLATGASWICYFRALQIGRASQVAPIDKLSVVLVALFAVLFLGERPAAREWVGISLMAVGAVVLAIRPSP